MFAIELQQRAGQECPKVGESGHSAFPTWMLNRDLPFPDQKPYRTPFRNALWQLRLAGVSPKVDTFSVYGLWKAG
jgi:hypothetical protein